MLQTALQIIRVFTMEIYIVVCDQIYKLSLFLVVFSWLDRHNNTFPKETKVHEQQDAEGLCVSWTGTNRMLLRSLSSQQQLPLAQHHMGA